MIRASGCDHLGPSLGQCCPLWIHNKYVRNNEISNIMKARKWTLFLVLIYDVPLEGDIERETVTSGNHLLISSDNVIETRHVHELETLIL